MTGNLPDYRPGLDEMTELWRHRNELALAGIAMVYEMLNGVWGWHVEVGNINGCQGAAFAAGKDPTPALRSAILAAVDGAK